MYLLGTPPLAPSVDGTPLKAVSKDDQSIGSWLTMWPWIWWWGSSIKSTLGARGHLPGGHIEVTLWFFKQCVHTLPRGYMLDSFAMYPPLWSQCDLWSHAGHCWNVPPKVATGFIGSLRVCGKIEPHWGFIVITLKRTPWGHCGHISGYFLKEVSMSGSGLWWTHCKQNCERTQGFHSKCAQGALWGGDISKVTSMWLQVTLWSKWGVHFKRVQHVPPG